MTIDTSGEWWKGSSPEDIGEFLRAWSDQEGNPVAEFRLARCACGSDSFTLEAEQDEGIARRTCVECGAARFICDGEENWSAGMKMAKWKCVRPCRSKVVNLGAGFALRKGDDDVKWIYVGHRCVECGVLGSMVDWKIDYGPSLQLIDQA